MRKLDLAQRKGSNRDQTKDPVVSHYDKKMEYALPKIRLDAISKKRTQIEYTSEFEAKFVTVDRSCIDFHSIKQQIRSFRFNLLEQDNSGLGDLQKYLKSNKRDLWLPKEQTKEIERGIWSENYLKKLHETLKVWGVIFSSNRNSNISYNFSNFAARNMQSVNYQSVWFTMSQRQQIIQCLRSSRHPTTRLTRLIKALFVFREQSKVVLFKVCCLRAWQSFMT